MADPAKGDARTRSVLRETDGYTWVLPGVPAEGPSAPPEEPAMRTPGVTFRHPAPLSEGTEEYRQVRGGTAVADLLRTPDPLPPWAVRELPAALCRAVTGLNPALTGRPRVTGVWASAAAFLEDCSAHGVPHAAELRDALGAEPPPGGFATVPGHRALGLGRFVVAEGQPPALDVLVPADPAPRPLSVCRTLAELSLIAQLFSQAGKASGADAVRVLGDTENLVLRQTGLGRATLRRGTAALVLDHARRLTEFAGWDTQRVELELDVALHVLRRDAADRTHPEEFV